MPIENKKVRILHVDDEEDTQKVVKTILEKEGYEVVSVRDGVGALREINLDNYDLLILDIMMPNMSGWELYTKILKIKEKEKVIFLSILDIPADKLNELTKSGVRDYIKKPFDRDDFVARVKKVLIS
ncbi:MAG: response regulator [bacterium]